MQKLCCVRTRQHLCQFGLFRHNFTTVSPPILNHFWWELYHSVSLTHRQKRWYTHGRDDNDNDNDKKFSDTLTCSDELDTGPLPGKSNPPIHSVYVVVLVVVASLAVYIVLYYMGNSCKTFINPVESIA